MRLKINLMGDETREAKQKSIELDSAIHVNLNNLIRITDLGVAIEIMIPADKTDIMNLKSNWTRILVWKKHEPERIQERKN